MNFKRGLIMLQAVIIFLGIQSASNDEGPATHIASQKELHRLAENAVEDDDFAFVTSLLKSGVNITGDGKHLRSLFRLKQSEKMRALLQQHEQQDDFEHADQ